MSAVMAEWLEARERTKQEPERERGGGGDEQTLMYHTALKMGTSFSQKFSKISSFLLKTGTCR